MRRPPFIQTFFATALLSLGLTSNLYAQSYLKCLLKEFKEEIQGEFKHFARVRAKAKESNGVKQESRPAQPVLQPERRIRLVGPDGFTMEWYQQAPYKPIESEYPESNSKHWSYAHDVIIRDRANQPIHKIAVVIPTFTFPNSTTINEAYVEKIRLGVLDGIRTLPMLHIDAVKKIKVYALPSKNDEYFSKTYREFSHAGMTAGSGIISVFPLAYDHLIALKDESMFRHEFGHLLAEKLWKKFEPPKEYMDSGLRDGNAVSSYGSNNWSEDFAEAVMVYIQSDAGRTSPWLRKAHPNRFAFLDQIFLNNPQAKQYVMYSVAAALVSVGAFSSNAKAGLTNGTVYIDDGDGKYIIVQDSD